ncbi:hypothetical protein CV093_13455 [Oceanobacillus sp. 143]|uniref:Uncharacterized protein n=1 Tax=Oceanobacillus zhaokaii TaxID=2052660 RepID=A0A345PI97_9BACI|nr:hypothetical protein [Oceanobacillus zhaokaii]AXI09727.1 hypothetical protein CUC15_12675 [Oceanobacillus zhaokaii]QGS69039.1 hypothetical protein CV093_13455 [Oceanobacillus sp. 143]
MKQQDKQKFDSFLKESFKNDVVVRELRLSDPEVGYLQQSFPNAEISSISKNKQQDKQWYKVTLQKAQIPQHV